MSGAVDVAGLAAEVDEVPKLKDRFGDAVDISADFVSAGFDCAELKDVFAGMTVFASGAAAVVGS